MIYQLLVAVAIAASASATLYTESVADQQYMWEGYKRDFRKEYKNVEEDNLRFGHFVQNLKAADARNAVELKNGGSAMYGITKFSDLSQAEFESRFLTADPSLKLGNAVVDNTVRHVDTTAGLVDWSTKLATPVKDQGYCGSCWAFSATEQIESDAMRTLGATYILSPEQITQCDSTSQGCNGGWTERAYSYVQRFGGLELDSDYPYTSYQGVTGTCKAEKNKAVVTVSGYKTLTSESAMASYVQSTGPLSVCLDAATWNLYQGGIVTQCGKRVDHCVQATGVDASTVGGYWKVRNSWGTGWGEAGFIRLAYGSDMCAITNDATYVTVAKV